MDTIETKITPSEIEIYTKNYCSYCAASIKLLKTKNLPFIEMNIDRHPEYFDEMILRSQKTTVPQIFINGIHIGGYDELCLLEAFNPFIKEELINS
jgi:glutaredoxin 3